MGLFSSSKPRITKEEFKRALGHVSGLSMNERNFINEFFEEDIAESSSLDKGIDEAELTGRIESLRSSQKINHLSDDEIDRIEAALRGML